MFCGLCGRETKCTYHQLLLITPANGELTSPAYTRYCCAVLRPPSVFFGQLAAPGRARSRQQSCRHSPGRPSMPSVVSPSQPNKAADRAHAYYNVRDVSRSMWQGINTSPACQLGSLSRYQRIRLKYGVVARILHRITAHRNCQVLLRASGPLLSAQTWLSVGHWTMNPCLMLPTTLLYIRPYLV